METTLHFDTAISISRLAQIIREQLPVKERLELVTLLQDEGDPSKELILSQLREDYTALRLGTLKTRTLKEVLDEL